MFVNVWELFACMIPKALCKCCCLGCPHSMWQCCLFQRVPDASNPASCYCDWEGSRWWLKTLGPCHPHGRPGRSLGLWLPLSWAPLVAAIWRINQKMEGLARFQISIPLTNNTEKKVVRKTLTEDELLQQEFPSRRAMRFNITQCQKYFLKLLPTWT